MYGHWYSLISRFKIEQGNAAAIDSKSIEDSGVF